MKRTILAIFILANCAIATAQQQGIGFGAALTRELVLRGSETVLVNGKNVLKPKEKNIFPIAPELSYFRINDGGTIMNDLIIGIRNIKMSYQDLTEDGNIKNVNGKYFQTYLAHQLSFILVNSANEKFKASVGTNSRFIYEKTSFTPQGFVANNYVFSIGGQMNLMYDISPKFKIGLRWNPDVNLNFIKTVIKSTEITTPTVNPDGQYTYNNSPINTKITIKRIEKKANVITPNFSLTLRYCFGKKQAQ